MQYASALELPPMHRIVFSPAALRKLDNTHNYITNTLKTPPVASSAIAKILNSLTQLQLLKTERTPLRRHQL